MSIFKDDTEFDPNKDVPVWINIVVPIICGVTFVVVLVTLYRTKKEVPVEKLERLVNSDVVVCDCC